MTSVIDKVTKRPKIYVYDDIIKSNGDPSPVSKIDGKTFDQLIANEVQNSALYQDPDAIYNSVLYNQAAASLAVADYGDRFLNSVRYTKPSTSILFENGTTRSWLNRALVKHDLTGLNTAEDLLQNCCISPPATTATTAGTASPTLLPRQTKSCPAIKSTPLPRGYPAPSVKHPQNLVAGYFPDSIPGTAVLSIPSFLTPTTCDTQLFEQVVATFLAQCTALSKERLIIDLRGNTGGKILLGYFVFSQVCTLQTLIAKISENMISKYGS